MVSQTCSTKHIETKQQVATKKLKTYVENAAVFLFWENEKLDSGSHQVKEPQGNTSEF